MKRDMELGRKILIEIGAKESNDWGPPPLIEGYSQEVVSYHLHLLLQAGLIEAKNLPGTTDWAVKALTWAGHEFLEAAKNDSLWEKAKKLALEKTGTFTFEALKLALIEVIGRRLS